MQKGNKFHWKISINKKEKVVAQVANYLKLDGLPQELI
jgi:hypothetical protein